MIGKTVSHYEITGKLGEGGMGVVYKARDTKLNRDVALKFLPADLTSDEESRKRFVREAQAAAALNHPNICAVYEIGESDGHTFIVMPCIEGAGLAGRLKDGPLPVDEALDIAIQVGKGLSKAHKNDITHRDIKPGNILITEDGHAKIVDFGLAKLGSLSKMTMVGTTLGTVGYMSPEQARGDEVDHRSDIWALGVVLYEMLSGRMPFRGEVDAVVIYSIMNEDPVPLAEACPECPDELGQVISTALAKETAGRFQSMDEMVAALEAIRSGKSVPTVNRPAGRSGGHFNRRIAIGVIAVAVIAAAVLGYRFLRPGQTIKSIAVLPLMDLSGENEEGGFADRLTGSLIGELGQINSIRWTCFYSVMQFKGSQMTVPEFCKKLEVDAAIVGSIQRDSTKVLLKLQLVDADTERHLWGADYDPDLEKLSNVFGEITLDLAGQLNAIMSPEAAAAMASHRVVSFEADNAYQKGTYWVKNRAKTANDKEALMKAIEFFNESLEADATYAKAWAGLAECYIRLSHGSAPLEGAVDKALDAVERALKLDDALGEAYFTKAHILWEHVWDQEGAAEAFRKGFELNPSNAYGNVTYAYYMQSMGRYEEASDAAIRATRLDPLSWFICGFAAFQPMAQGGRKDMAIEHVNNMVELFPDMHSEWMKHTQISLIYEFAGYYEQAMEEWQIAYNLKMKNDDLTSDDIAGWHIEDLLRRARLNSVAGNEAEAAILWKEYGEKVDVESNAEDYPLRAAEYYAWQGDLDKAFLFLEKAYEIKDMWITRLTVLPWYEPLRGDPRYDDLVKRIGLR